MDKQILIIFQKYRLNSISIFAPIIHFLILGAMQDNKQMVVSLSGFSDDEQVNKYKQMLSEIGCKYLKQLSKDVNYLIVNHTCTEKYKIAQLKASSTQTLTIQWLKDSYRQKKLLSINKYRIDKIFYGVRIAIEGFEDKKIQSKIVELLKSNGALEVKEGALGILPQELNSNYQVIIVPNTTLYRRLQAKLQHFVAIPIVTPEWVQESLKSKKCKYPHDYALNYQNISNVIYESRPNLERLNKKIKNYLELQFLNSNNGLFSDNSSGEQFIILFDHNSIEKQIICLMQKLICLNNGLYLNSYSPAVTHILVGPIEQNDHYKLMNHGDSVLILRLQWVIDCILFSEKLPQNDYKVRSYKSPLIQSNSSLHITDSYLNPNQYSQSFLQSYQVSKNTNSMGIGGAQTKSQTVANIVATKSKVLKTEIFKGKFFYIDQNQKKEKAMQLTIAKIKENGGCAISQSTLPSIRNRMVFLILKDSSDNSKIIEKVRKEVCKQVPLIPLSTRWIQQCAKKQEYLDYNKQNYFTYRSFFFQTPVREFMSIKIQILGVDQILKRRYKQLLNALGVSKVSPNIAEITHCLCGEAYESDPRYIAIVNVLEKDKEQKEKETVSKDSSASKNISIGMNRIKYIKVKWLMDYLNSSGKATIDQYLIGQ